VFRHGSLDRGAPVIQHAGFEATGMQPPNGSRYWSCDLTHTATSGLSAVLAAKPQDAETWLRNIAGFLPGPQYAVTRTSSALH
jgi:hypothetical protein